MCWALNSCRCTCVFVHVASDVHRISSLLTRAHAYVYLWHRMLSLQCNSWTRVPAKAKKKPPRYEDASNNQIDNMFKQHTYECGKLSPTPVPQTSMLVRIGLTAHHNIELTGSGVFIYWCNRFGSEARGLFFAFTGLGFCISIPFATSTHMQAVVMPYRCACVFVFYAGWTLDTQKHTITLNTCENQCENRCKTNENLKTSWLLNYNEYSLYFKNQEVF